MKKAIILGISLLVVLVGVFIFIAKYAFDNNHFGEELEIYADTSSVMMPITAEVDGKTYLIHPYNRYNVYNVATRVSTKKKHYSETTTDCKPLTVHFGEKISMTLYDDPTEEDLTYFTYDNDGKKSYYAVSKLKMYNNMLKAVGEESGNILISRTLSDSESATYKEFSDKLILDILDKGMYSALAERGSDALIEIFSSIEAKNNLAIETMQLKKYGDYSGITEFSCVETSSGGGGYFFYGLASFAEGWKPFCIFYSENKIQSFSLL